ncbi:MAG: hypothetical protein HY683_00675 [Chloroflexi bacterium]|nr:hypothetical protein [Chloroflexota bacterium]
MSRTQDGNSPAVRGIPLAALALVALVLVATLTGCRGRGPGTTDSGQQAAGRDTLAGMLAGSEFLVGEDRFPFGVRALDGGLVEGAKVHARFLKLGQGGKDQFKGEADAAWREVRGTTPHQHPDSQVHLHEEVQGIYVVNGVTFDEPGFWQARLEVRTDEASKPQTASIAFEVSERSVTFGVGERVPSSRNLTVRDARELADITTHSPPEPGLYQLTVADALEQGKPLVVAFATPAFCVSRMCGPVTDVVAQVYQGWHDRATFIHIEPYRLDIVRSEGRLVLADVTKEWRLPSEPWVFVVDGQGRVAARFEGLVTAEELEAALQGVGS